jgi:YhcH/YjgK/YiaL family protein
MIYDNLKNIRRYEILHPNFSDAFSFLLSENLKILKIGQYQINENVYASVSEYFTKPSTELRWETHRKYIDIQYLINGNERIGYSFGNDFVNIEPYNSEKDIAFYHGNGSEIDLGENYFVILFPEEFHKPCILKNHSMQVKKLVIKVRL